MQVNTSDSLSLNETSYSKNELPSGTPMVLLRWIPYQKQGQTFMTKFNVALF